MATGGRRRGAGGGGRSTRKCATTGHFFICNPQHVAPFACFECHQRFAPPTKSTLYFSNPHGSTRYGGSHHSRVSSDSSLKKSLGLSPLSSETQTVTTSSESSSCRLSHLPISKPWRCLVEKCLLLACDKCSDALIAQAGIGDQVGVSNRKADSLSSLPVNHHPNYQRPRIYTPENRPCTQEGPLKVDADIDNNHDDPEESVTKLVYRRAGYAADSAIAAHYHHRAPRRVNRPPPLATTKTTESTRAKPETNVTPSALIISGTLQIDDSATNGGDEEDDEAWIAAQRASVQSAEQAGQRAVKKAYLRQMTAMNSLEQFG